MMPTSRAPATLVATLATVLLVAACRNAGAGSPSAAASAGGEATVMVATSGEVGEHLVDADGRTLYVFLNDTPGQSNCSEDCAETWPPLTVEDGGTPTAGEGVTASLETIERGDGSLHVTLDGWPLYLYAEDAQPGDLNGEGVGDVWFVARPDGSVPEPSGDAEASAGASPAESGGDYDPYDR